MLCCPMAPLMGKIGFENCVLLSLGENLLSATVRQDLLSLHFCFHSESFLWMFKFCFRVGYTSITENIWVIELKNYVWVKSFKANL